MNSWVMYELSLDDECDRFRYILGEFPLQASTPAQAILQYQALCLKASNCPFGVRVYGSVYEVSYSTVITVSSVWVSMFVFLLGSSIIQSRT